MDAGADHARDASDGGKDASPPDTTAHDAGRDAMGDGAPDGSTDAGGPDACPPQHYLNTIRHLCVPAHDLNGDGKADLMAVNLDGINALISTGTSFMFYDWLNARFVGAGGAYAADVTGSGYADGIAFDNTYVFAIGTGGPGFGSIPANLAVWLPSPFLGEIATSVVDVDGDGRADAVRFNGQDISVALSTGESFEEPTQWLAVDLTQYLEVYAADVDGDGMSDAILLGTNSVEVCRSTGTSFSPPVVWDQSPLTSDIATLFADVNGDGRIDGIQIENDSISVSLSNGHGFEPATSWYVSALYGSLDTVLADADGDGMADVIVVDAAKVIVALSTGSSFAAPTVWYSGSFHADANFEVAPDPGGSFIATGLPTP